MTTDRPPDTSKLSSRSTALAGATIATGVAIVGGDRWGERVGRTAISVCFPFGVSSAKLDAPEPEVSSGKTLPARAGSRHHRLAGRIHPMPSRQAEEPVIERYRPSSAMTDEFVWEAVYRLLDGTSDFEALRAHRLHLLAGRRWRELGEEIPTELAQDERLAAIVALLAPGLLRRVVSLCDTSVVLHKGPEIAARYPDPVLRPCIDLDVLVEDAESTRRAVGGGPRRGRRSRTLRTQSAWASARVAGYPAVRRGARRPELAELAGPPADGGTARRGGSVRARRRGPEDARARAPRADRGCARLDTWTDGSRRRSRRPHTHGLGHRAR